MKVPNFKFSFQNSLAIFMVAISCFYLYFSPNHIHLDKLTTPEQIQAAIQLATNDAQIRTFAIALVMLIGTFYFGSSKDSQNKNETIASMQSGPAPKLTDVNKKALADLGYLPDDISKMKVDDALTLIKYTVKKSDT